MMPLASPVRLPFEKLLRGSITEYEVMRAESGPGREYVIKTHGLTTNGFTLKDIDGRSAAHDKPWMLVRNTKSHQGIGISIAYSGNWQIQILQHGSDILFRVTTLPESLEPFTTVNGLPIPGAIVAEFSGSWDNGAQSITRFTRKRLLRDLGDNWPLLMYNTWFDRKQLISESHLLKSVDAAANLGCELFVIDAGWYGEHSNEMWGASLGDWTVNPERLPNASQCATLYKKLRPIIRNADVFHLTDQADLKHPASVQAMQYFDREQNKNIIFAFQANAPSLSAQLKLHDLQADGVYRIVVPKGFSFTFPYTMTGKELMAGLKVVFPNKGASAIILIEPQSNRLDGARRTNRVSQ